MSILFGGRGRDNILGGNQDDWIYGGNGRDTLDGGKGDDCLYGGNGRDKLLGGEGNDLLSGGRGRDTLIGGEGIDHLYGGRGKDVAIYSLAENGNNSGPGSEYYDGGRGRDTLILKFSADEWARSDIKESVFAYVDQLEGGRRGETFLFEPLNLNVRNFETLKVLVDGEDVDPSRPPLTVIDLSDSTTDEVIEPDGDTNTDIKSGSGDDTITTGNGNNLINAGDGDNMVSTGSGNDTITTGSGNDTITIGDGDDVVYAGAGDDMIIAGNAGGNDFIDGGPGNDTVAYTSLESDEPVIIDLNEIDRSSNGAATDLLIAQGLPANTDIGLTDGGAWVGTDVLISIEHAIGGSGNDTISGTDATNFLIGGDGDDFISGIGGKDELEGGNGADVLNGGADDDLLTGGSGDDTIDGGIGFDELILTGQNTDYLFYYNFDGTYTVIDNGGNGDGVDIFYNIEQVTFANTSTGLGFLVEFFYIPGTPNADTLNGSLGSDIIDGMAGDDEINGLKGEDILIGGPGNDIIDGGSGTDDDLNFLNDVVDYGDGGTQGVWVDLGNQTAIDNFGDTDTLIEIERVFGTNSNDTLIGSLDDDFFDPHGGNDTIHGGAGSDSLMYHLSDGRGGPLGIVADFDDIVVGSGTVIDPFGDLDTFTGIEVLRGTGIRVTSPYDFADYVNGGAGFQDIRTYAGNDTVDGTVGQQRVSYHQDASYGGLGGISVDMEVVDINGFAMVTDGFGDMDLIKDVEEVRGTGATDVISGDSADNRLRGEAGDDILEGRGGTDRLEGGLGDDDLDGGTGNDVLTGGPGNDTLVGGEGFDWLTGGSGSDTFEFSSSSGDDTITDFSVGQDMLLLLDGLTITSLSEAELGGEVGLDTLVELSSGDTITLLDVSDVGDLLLLM